MAASDQAVSGNITAGQWVGTPSSKQEESLPVSGSAVESSERLAAVVSQSPSGKSRARRYAVRPSTVVVFVVACLAWLEGCAPPENWAGAEGILPDRMLDPGAGETHSLYRTLGLTSKGECLVRLQYPGGDLFGTPYDIEVLDRQGRVLQRGQVVAGQDDTPYCVAEVRTESERLPEALRGRWLLAVGFWNSGRRAHPLLDTDEEGAEGSPDEDDDDFTVYFELPDWEGDGVELAYGSGNLGGRDSTVDVRWIETGPDLLAGEATRPGLRRVGESNTFSVAPRAEVERRLPELLGAESPERVRTGLNVILGHGVRSETARPEVRAALDRLLFGHGDPFVREEALVALERLLGREVVPLLRRALLDEAPEVRASAAVGLAWHRDETSLDALMAACPGLVGHHFASEVIGAFGKWGDRRLVPGLIAFLGDTTQQAGRWRGGMFLWDETFDSLEAPNTCAQRVLKRMTALEFPLDVSEARMLWREAKMSAPATGSRTGDTSPRALQAAYDKIGEDSLQSAQGLAGALAPFDLSQPAVERFCTGKMDAYSPGITAPQTDIHRLVAIANANRERGCVWLIARGRSLSARGRGGSLVAGLKVEYAEWYQYLAGLLRDRSLPVLRHPGASVAPTRLYPYRMCDSAYAQLRLRVASVKGLAKAAAAKGWTWPLRNIRAEMTHAERDVLVERMWRLLHAPEARAFVRSRPRALAKLRPGAMAGHVRAARLVLARCRPRLLDGLPDEKEARLVTLLEKDFPAATVKESATRKRLLDAKYSAKDVAVRLAQERHRDRGLIEWALLNRSDRSDVAAAVIEQYQLADRERLGLRLPIVDLLEELLRTWQQPEAKASGQIVEFLRSLSADAKAHWTVRQRSKEILAGGD
jgi:hypothetical protein